MRRDNRLNGFGKEFLVLGHDLTALKYLELLDPDKDGVSTADENRARSNPGESSSTPLHPGPWLVGVSSALAPAREIFEVLGSTAFRIISWETSLEVDVSRRIELSIGMLLSDIEKHPLVYWIYDTTGAWVGAATYAVSGQKNLTTYVVVAWADKAQQKLTHLAGCYPVRIAGDQRFAHRKYYERYRRKTDRALIEIEGPSGEERKNEEILLSVRRALRIMKALGRPRRVNP